LRYGSYLPSLLESRRRAEKALLNVIHRVYNERVSTRRVDDLLKAHLSYPKLGAKMTGELFKQPLRPSGAGLVVGFTGEKLQPLFLREITPRLATGQADHLIQRQ
jgi:hypothetical protein